MSSFIDRLKKLSDREWIAVFPTAHERELHRQLAVLEGKTSEQRIVDLVREAAMERGKSIEGEIKVTELLHEQLKWRKEPWAKELLEPRRPSLRYEAPNATRASIVSYARHMGHRACADIYNAHCAELWNRHAEAQRSGDERLTERLGRELETAQDEWARANAIPIRRKDRKPATRPMQARRTKVANNVTRVDTEKANIEPRVPVTQQPSAPRCLSAKVINLADWKRAKEFCIAQ